MLVGEGFFTTLSASECFALPGWALMSTRNLRGWSPPEGVRSVLIAADRGKDGEASAEAPSASAGSPGPAEPDRFAAGALRRLERGGQPWPGAGRSQPAVLGPGGPAERVEQRAGLGAL